jgi:hypothetical protein
MAGERTPVARPAYGDGAADYAGAVLVPDLRPLSVGEIIDVAVKIWRRHFATLAKLVFVVVAPVQILSALVAASVTTGGGIETVDAAGNSTVDGGRLAAFIAGMFTAQVLSGLAFLISSAAVLRAVSVAYLGGTPEWQESLRAATSRLGSLIWLAFLMGAGLVLAALALFFPFIWLGVSWAVAFPVLIAEGQRGAGALRRSFGLVRGRWWPVFGALFLAFLLQFFIGLVLGIPLGLVTANSDSGSAGALILSTLVSVASSVVTTPFMAAVLVLIYFDLRVRKEGFDLELLSQGVGIPTDALPGGAPWQGSGGTWPGPGAPTGGGAWPAPGGSWPDPSGGSPGPWGEPGAGSAPPPPPPPPSPPPAAPRPPDTTARSWDEPIDPTGGWGRPPEPGSLPDEPAGRDERPEGS